MLAFVPKAGTHYATGVTSAAREGGFLMPKTPAQECAEFADFYIAHCMSPAKSRKQQRFLFAKKGKAWVKAHHFDKLSRKGKRRKSK